MVKAGRTKSVLLLAFLGIMIIGMVQPISAVDSSDNKCNDSSSGQCGQDSSKDECENSSSASMTEQDSSNDCEESSDDEECMESDKENWSTQANMECADYHMEEAMKIHNMHLKNPNTSTEESNMEMMEHMVESYACLTGGNLSKDMMDYEKGSENKIMMHDCILEEDSENETTMMNHEADFEYQNMMHNYMMNCMMHHMNGDHSANETMMMEEDSSNMSKMNCPYMLEGNSANISKMNCPLMAEDSTNMSKMNCPCMTEEDSENDSCFMAEMGENISSDQVRTDCAIFWLKDAIEQHEMHMKDPSTETGESQMELMFEMMKVNTCITGKNMMMEMNETSDDKLTEWLNSEIDNESAIWMKITVDYEPKK